MTFGTKLCVLNKKTDVIPEGAVYIGRGSPWGNPFSHNPRSKAETIVATREEAIAAFEAWFLAQPELVAAAKEKLRGKTLVCFCKPLACHGDFLLRIANS
jgi:hypothetical protein